MQLLVAISTLAFILAGASVGLRLLRLAAQSRERPELWIGIALFGLSGVAYPFGILGGSGRFAAPSAAALQAVALVAVAVAGFSHCAFVRHVFRPAPAWSGFVLGLVAVSWAGFALSGLHELWRTASPLPQEGTRVLVRQALMSGGFAWGTVEALVYHRKLRRRLALGLADPVVVDRMALWALAAGFALLSSSTMFAVTVTGADALAHPLSRLGTSIGGLGASATLLLGFAPPHRYLAHVRARAARRGDRSAEARGA